MLRRVLFVMAFVGAVALLGLGGSEAQAHGCRRGGYGGGYYRASYPAYHGAYYHRGPAVYYGRPAYRSAYYGGYPGYYGGYRSGVSVSFGW